MEGLISKTLYLHNPRSSNTSPLLSSNSLVYRGEGEEKAHAITLLITENFPSCMRKPESGLWTSYNLLALASQAYILGSGRLTCQWYQLGECIHIHLLHSQWTSALYIHLSTTGCIVFTSYMCTFMSKQFALETTVMIVGSGQSLMAWVIITKQHYYNFKHYYKV